MLRPDMIGAFTYCRAKSIHSYLFVGAKQFHG